MSARLITGRPLIAGIGNYLLGRITQRLRCQATSDPASSSGRPRNLSPLTTGITRGRNPRVFYNAGQAPQRFMPPSVGVSAAPRGQAADGAFAEALSAVPPSGADPAAAAPVATVRDPRSASGRGRPRPGIATTARSSTTLPTGARGVRDPAQQIAVQLMTAHRRFVFAGFGARAAGGSWVPDVNRIQLRPVSFTYWQYEAYPIGWRRPLGNGGARRGFGCLRGARDRGTSLRSAGCS